VVSSPSACSLQLCELDVRLYLNVRTGEWSVLRLWESSDQLGGGGRVGGEGEKGSWSSAPNAQTDGRQGAMWEHRPRAGCAVPEAVGEPYPRRLQLPSSSQGSKDPALSKCTFKSHSTATSDANVFYTCIQAAESSIFKM